MRYFFYTRFKNIVGYSIDMIGADQKECKR